MSKPSSNAFAEELLGLGLDFLATYRLTTLIKDDKITEDLRGMVFDRYGEPTEDNPRKVSYLMSCPWCLSIYFGMVAVVGRRRFPRLWGPAAKVLAMSAMTGLAAERRANRSAEVAATTADHDPAGAEL
jgi:hypothetical protein